MRKAKLMLLSLLALMTSVIFAREYNVAVNGCEKNNGSAYLLFKNVSAAAQVAQSGDVIIALAGTIGEEVTPPCSGERPVKRIIYRAVNDETAEIKGSDVNHGPYFVDKNTFLSKIGFLNVSEGGEIVHNLISGRLVRITQLTRPKV